MCSCAPVVYVCCPWDIFRTLMVHFWQEGEQLEDYVFFFIDLFAEGLEGRGPVRPWYRGDQDDQAAHHAFRVSHVTADREEVSCETKQLA